MKKIDNLQRTIYKLCFLLFLAFYILYSTFYIPDALATDSTPSAPIKSESADFKQKLKVLQEEIASKAAKLKQEVSQKLQNKAYIGFVKSKSDTSLTIATITGTKIININEFTEYSGKTATKTKLSFKTLAVDDYIAALGDIDDNEVLTSKRILKTEPVKPVTKQIVFGQVTAVDRDNQVITLQTKNGQSKSFTCTDNTNIKIGKNDAGFIDIKFGRNIIVVVVESPSGGQIARLVDILGAANDEAKTASASAVPTKLASPSAAIKKSR
jgi:hypothetical protein